MANLDEMIATVIREGYSQANAAARVCQDIVLKAISKSSFSDHITVKGGVVMRSITGDARRATQDDTCSFLPVTGGPKCLSAPAGISRRRLSYHLQLYIKTM